MGKVRLAREQEQQELVLRAPAGVSVGWQHRPGPRTGAGLCTPGRSTVLPGQSCQGCWGDPVLEGLTVLAPV